MKAQMLSAFLAAFFPKNDEKIHLRAFAPKKVPQGDARFMAQKFVLTRQRLEFDEMLMGQLVKLNETRGLYFVVNSGGDKDEEIVRFNAWFVEDDSSPIEEQNRKLDTAPLPPSLRVETHKSVHAYWLIEGECSKEEWSDIQRRLISYFGGDDKIKNPSRVMRLPYFNHVRYESGELQYKQVEVLTSDPSRRYTVEEMLAAFPPVGMDENSIECSADGGTPDGTEFATWDELNAETALRIRRSPKARTDSNGWTQAPGICHGSTERKAIYVSPDGAYGCHKGCDTATIRAAYGLPSKPNLPERVSSIVDCQQKYTDGSGKSSGKIRPLHTIRLSEVEAKNVDWLWRPFIPLGAFTVLEGEEDLGKTYIGLALATATATGRGFPLNSSDEPFPPRNVVLMSAEDSISHVLKPRLELMNAPCERIIAVEEVFSLDRDGILRLEMVLASLEPKLVVIDPIFSYAGRINIDRDNEIRSVTGELRRLAEKYDCSILGFRHIGKSKGLGEARAAGLNGIAWRASARSVLLVGKDPDDPRKRAIVQTKSNLGPKYQGGVGFEIRDGQFFWTGESDLTAERMLSRPLDGDTRSEQQDAVEFLREALAEGEREAKDVENEAGKFGLTNSQLRTARITLGAKWRREGFGRGSKIYWRLPPTAVQGKLIDV